MLASQRKQQILAQLAQDKMVHSAALSAQFNVSEDSIRRDLRELAAAGLLQRVHGGALPVSAAIAPFETRKNVQSQAKKSIAQKAIKLIQPGQVVITLPQSNRTPPSTRYQRLRLKVKVPLASAQALLLTALGFTVPLVMKMLL